jgi:hypothetical protein
MMNMPSVQNASASLRISISVSCSPIIHSSIIILVLEIRWNAMIQPYRQYAPSEKAENADLAKLEAIQWKSTGRHARQLPQPSRLFPPG